MVIISSQPFSMASFSVNDSQLPAGTVISTEAGQPPIGKPLIGQARGQLRLTWRLYAESPQSGEISLSNGVQHSVWRSLDSAFH